jgi:hypothetical protein
MKKYLPESCFFYLVHIFKIMPGHEVLFSVRGQKPGGNRKVSVTPFDMMPVKASKNAPYPSDEEIKLPPG